MRARLVSDYSVRRWVPSCSPSSSTPSLLSISRPIIRCQSSTAATTTAPSPPQQTEAGKPHAHLRQYLDAWMGSTGTTRNTARGTTTSPHQHRHAPRHSSAGHPVALTVAGKSYLVPTLRLPRGVSPIDLQAGLRATTSLSAGYFKSAPIVVDLGEWMTSQPLPRGGVRTEAAGKGGEVLDAGLLGEFVEALREAGLHPVGIANATATDVQAAAMALGLPCFMGRHGGNGNASSSSSSNTQSAPAPAVAAAAPAPAVTAAASSSRPARKPTMAAAHLPSMPPPSAAPAAPKAAKTSSVPSLPPSSSSTSMLPTKVISNGMHLPRHSQGQNSHSPSLPPSLPPFLPPLPKGNPRLRPHRTTSSSRRRFARHSGACQLRSRSLCGW